MKMELLPEPKVEFGDNFLCDDPKMGISIGGFFSSTNNSHKSEINYSIIGTKTNIQDLNDWIESLKSEVQASVKKLKLKNETSIKDGEIQSLFEEDYVIESQIESEQSKKMNPDFIGFNKDSKFKCEFQNDESNNLSFKKKEIEVILDDDDLSNIDKANKVIETIIKYFELLQEENIVKPDICFIVIPSKVYKKLSSIKFGKQRINFRRKLKAKIIESKGLFPVQLILEDTIKGKKKQLQDKSMIAWNFVTAQYYKTESCVPWALTEIDNESLFIGISFHKVINGENDKVRSSIAQAFSRDGKGLVFTGKQFEWDSKITKAPAPHLNYDYAKNFVKEVLSRYIQLKKHTPKRIVFHKTTDFWDAYINSDYAEIEGLRDGIEEIIPHEVDIDFVSIKSSKIKLLRPNGNYPVMRGTLLSLSEDEGILYTTGYIPYYETYPGVHVPCGLHLKLIGDSTLREVSREILALTKMNFNNCNYYDSLPITLRFAQKVGQIIQYLPEDIDPPNKYYHYM